MHKRKDEVRDIYQGGDVDFDKDFTPQVAEEQLEARQRDLRRSRIVAVFFGIVIVVLAVLLVSLINREFLTAQTPSENDQPPAEPETPQNALSADALWIMDVPVTAALNEADAQPGPKPLSTTWIKAAANHIIMGQQALALKQPEKALDDFRKTTDIYPDILGLRQAKGVLCLQQKNYAEAATDLEKALKEKKTFDTINNLGAAYIELEQYDKAENYLKQALEMQPENPGCHKSLAELYQKMNRDNDAIYHFEKYIDLQPDDLDTLQTYALYLTQLGRWKDAAEALTRLTRTVTDVAPLYFLLAQVQVQNRQPEKALQALKSGVQQIDPDLARTWLQHKEFDSLRRSKEFKALTAAPQERADSPQ
jgi:tetratricopeptide (TPR) repeat protein